MPNRLLELGATQLLELGTTRQYWMGDTPSPVPSVVHSIYDMVNTFEDPLAATGIVDDDLTAEALNIVNRIRTVNRRVRYSMGSSIQLGDIAGYDDLIGMGYQLNGLYLGKSFFKKVAKKVKKIHKTVAKKVINVVKSPAFLSIAALVVNVIPGVGQAASVALAAAAAARKVYAQKIDEKKAKKAQAALTAAEAAEFLKQIKDYNLKTQEYYESAKYPIPLNTLLDANGDPTSDPSKMPGIKYPININGVTYQPPANWGAATLPGIVSTASQTPAPAPKPPTPAPPAPVPTSITQTPQPFVTPQQANQAAALPIAMALNNGQGSWQANALLHSFPPETQRQIAGEVGEIQKFVNDPSFKPTSVKAIGQFVAMSEFDRGAGLGIMTEDQHALADAVKENATPEVMKAIEAGRQALLTSAAIDGADAVKGVREAIEAGQGSKVPWTYILLGLGVAAAGGVGYALARR